MVCDEQPLSTVHPHHSLHILTVYTEEMGRTAMDVLNKQVLAPREIPTLTMLGTKLTLRESTK